MRRFLWDVAAPIVVGVGVILLFGFVAHTTGWAHEPSTAERASADCAALDAIAVQTPDGWECITAAVVVAR